MKLIPESLPAQFSTKDYAQHTHTNIKNAQLAANIFKYIGIIEQTGKDGRNFLYSRK